MPTRALQVIKAICQDPDYQRNRALHESMDGLSYFLKNVAPFPRPELTEELLGFWGFAGETAGTIWAPIVRPSGREFGLEWWLDQIEFHCSLSQAGDTGLTFPSGLGYFLAEFRRVDTPILDQALASSLARFLEGIPELRVIGPDVEDLRHSLTRFTAAYLLCYRTLREMQPNGWDDQELLPSMLAECYGAQARLRAVVVDCWLRLQIQS